ncbi:MAG: hypothetical protein L6R41_002897 [Letrouitia leprolyta]|nr:MAG: hypothetical protein L6R41_002897 [Letrouitia leprolyta]
MSQSGSVPSSPCSYRSARPTIMADETLNDRVDAVERQLQTVDSRILSLQQISNNLNNDALSTIAGQFRAVETRAAFLLDLTNQIQVNVSTVDGILRRHGLRNDRRIPIHAESTLPQTGSVGATSQGAVHPAISPIQSLIDIRPYHESVAMIDELTACVGELSVRINQMAPLQPTVTELTARVGLLFALLNQVSSRIDGFSDRVTVHTDGFTSKEAAPAVVTAGKPAVSSGRSIPKDDGTNVRISTIPTDQSPTSASFNPQAQTFTPISTPAPAGPTLTPASDAPITPAGGDKALTTAFLARSQKHGIKTTPSSAPSVSLSPVQPYNVTTNPLAKGYLVEPDIPARPYNPTTNPFGPGNPFESDSLTESAIYNSSNPFEKTLTPGLKPAAPTTTAAASTTIGTVKHRKEVNEKRKEESSPSLPAAYEKEKALELVKGLLAQLSKHHGIDTTAASSAISEAKSSIAVQPSTSSKPIASQNEDAFSNSSMDIFEKTYASLKSSSATLASTALPSISATSTVDDKHKPLTPTRATSNPITVTTLSSCYKQQEAAGPAQQQKAKVLSKKENVKPKKVMTKEKEMANTFLAAIEKNFPRGRYDDD